MDLPDGVFTRNLDWDPNYLRQLFEEDFYEFENLWCSNIGDQDIVSHVEKMEKIYSNS